MSEFCGTAGEAYRPSNGSEGDFFQAKYCNRCDNDWLFRTFGEGTGCHILAKTLIFDTRDEEYPKEWVYNDAGRPVCTAFVLVKEVKP